MAEAGRDQPRIARGEDRRGTDRRVKAMSVARERRGGDRRTGADRRDG